MSPVGLVIARMNTAVPRELAWTHLIDAELRRSWWPDLQLAPALGGTVTEQWADTGGDEPATRDAVGTVDVLVDGHALGFRWRDRRDEHETEVLITLRSNDAGTGITVTETGFGKFRDAHSRAADAQQGWIDLLTAFVAGLKEVEFDPAAFAPAVAAAAAVPVAADVAESSDIDTDSDPDTDSDTVDVTTMTSEIEVIEPPVEVVLEDDATDDDANVEIEVDAEPVLAELVAEVSIVHEELLEVAIEVDAEPEAVNIEVEPDEPDFDSLLRGLQ